MEACNLNWDLVIKFIQIIIPLGIALFVYHIWHEQKGKEVVANEVKELLKNILEEMTIISLLRYETQKNISLIEEKIERLNNLTQINIRSILFIENCLHEKDLGTLFTNYNIVSTDTYVLLKYNTMKAKDPKEFMNFNIQSKNNLDEYIKPTEAIIKKLSPFAIYTKKISLKKFK
ncbi:TPA: hypothetical protein JIR17_14035 [Acinetobacter baumannii]|uniref:hypothetical protein n=1 Tax=Acinetobacter baumannii TaxID=470 RepID=UPI00070CD089|nr:hypothetical protein [Acinetobacter baumannii]KRJ37400.1 hypothetical protein APC83_16780 [Acinetobacter baumannii]MDC4381572.1 hypothetical protein [Acinetobacter baumannii]HAW7017250.1 hypothetical protein [Acinetobacter baumannii]HAW7025333.1 hypothetical protein [Acinetobacter baumannii]HAW7034710.1 hypothetical protein [Acinetobacter baumannii]